MVDTLLLIPSLHFSTLHPNTLHSTSLHLLTLHFLSFKLHPNTIHCPLIWLKPIEIFYRSISPHITTLRLTPLHCIFRWFSPNLHSFHFIPFIIAFLTPFLKILPLQWQVPNASAGSWFQFLVVLFTKECFQIFPIPVPNFPNTINPAQVKRPSHPVAYRFSCPFPIVPFKKCA